MKFPVLLAGIVACMLILTACQAPGQELVATPTLVPTTTTVPEPAVAAPEETPVPQQPEPQAVPQPPAPVPAKLNATQQACLALELHVVEDRDHALREMNRKKRDYERAVSKYDAALDAPVPDAILQQELRAGQDAAEDAYKDAEDAYNDVARKLSKMRAECGLPDKS